MRLAGAFLVLALATSTSFADDRPPFEVVSALPKTEQVLVFDRTNNTHVLVKPGSIIDDYAVVEINGIGMVVEKDGVRTTMYPLRAQEIVLSLETPDKNPPAIYGKNPVKTPPANVADIGGQAADPKANVAVELASMLTTATPTAPSITRTHTAAPALRSGAGYQLPGRFLKP
jgi:hypothetical protein